MGPGLIRAIVFRPRLWGEAWRTYLATLPHRWFAQRRLPIPDVRYMRWRRVTAYGTVATEVDSRDVVSYLEWRRRYRRATSRRGAIAGG